MKINEFFDQPIDDKLPFDVVDDVCVFMRNDPMFYRKSFFPAVKRMQHCGKNKLEWNMDEELGPMIDKAVKLYCSKFKINKRPNELLTAEERTSCMEKIYAEEMTMINKGHYR